jgi:hypothetical protein
MLVFHYVAHQYVGDQKLDALHAHDLMLDALHVDDQTMDAQMTCVLGDLLLDAQNDQYVAQMCVTCRLLALMNENARILELQYFHQLAFQRVA